MYATVIHIGEGNQGTQILLRPQGNSGILSGESCHLYSAERRVDLRVHADNLRGPLLNRKVLGVTHLIAFLVLAAPHLCKGEYGQSNLINNFCSHNCSRL